MVAKNRIANRQNTQFLSPKIVSIVISRAPLNVCLMRVLRVPVHSAADSRPGLGGECRDPFYAPGCENPDPPKGSLNNPVFLHKLTGPLRVSGKKGVGTYLQILNLKLRHCYT